MAKDTFYFSHDYHARTDKEIMRLRMKMGMCGVGLYWCIVEMLYEEDGYLPLSEYERISFELQSKYEDVKSVIEDFSLFKKDEKKFWSDAVIKRLNKRKEKSEKAKESISYRWNDTNVKRTKNDSNTNKGKERKGNNKRVSSFFSPNGDENSQRGVRFDENLEHVFFEDGSKQKIGDEQKFLIEQKRLSPIGITKGIIR